MKIFVTGGEGFIGSYLIDSLVRGGHQVASFDGQLNFTNIPVYYKKCAILRKKFLKCPYVNFKGDIRDLATLINAIENFNPEIVVHLAGLPMAKVADEFKHEMIPINLYGTLNVLEAFEQSSAIRFVYTSSSMAYGHFTTTPQPEKSILDPQNIYGATKAAGEHFVSLSTKDWVIVRPTSVYGFTDCANRVTQILVDNAYLGKDAWVVEGESLDFSYITDVVDGFSRCILDKNASKNIFNISRGQSRSSEEFARIIKKHFPEFRYEVRKPSGQQTWRGAMDVSKAKSILSFNPKVDIEEGIERTLFQIRKYKFY